MEAQENWHPLISPCGPGNAPPLRFGPIGMAELQQRHQSASTRADLFPRAMAILVLCLLGSGQKPSCWVDTGRIYCIITHFPCLVFLLNECSSWMEWMWQLTLSTHMWVTCLQILVWKPFVTCSDNYNKVFTAAWNSSVVEACKTGALLRADHVVKHHYEWLKL